jgi:L,D-transpeptidase catalytic domain
MICRTACRSASGRWPRRALAGAIALLALAVAGSLSAQANRTAKLAEALQSRPMGTPVLAVVSLGRQRVTVYDADGRIMRAPVSTGKTGYETPAGIYSILQKREEHYSNLYDDASMPHMQRITWSGIALHAGPLPGYPASHGCIRMPADFAEQLFGVTRLGMRVVVMRDDIAPVDFTHPVLFKPEPQSHGPQSHEPQPAPAQPGVSAVSIQGEPAAAPVQNLRALAVAKAGEAAAAKARAEEARLAAVQQSRQAARATRSLRMAQAAKTRADAQLWKADRQLELAGAPEARQRAQEAKAQALLQQGQAQAALEKVEAEIGPVQELWARLRESAQAAWKARLAAEEEAKEAARKVSPISVFISRKTQRLYVRQSREPLFDSPVAIAGPDEPLGTYVFTALAYANEEETALRWNAVSLYDGMPSPAPVKGRRSAGKVVDAAATDPAAAAAALDRIAIPKEAIERIAQIVSPGSSLIVSDEEISRETGSGTDFIIVMSTDPQGGIAIRRRNDPVADGFRFERPFFGRNPYAWGRRRSFW